MLDSAFNAVIRQDGPCWIGWIEEVPGVNSQGATREELLSNLREALAEAIAMNRDYARSMNGQRSAVPRHSEISNILAPKICRDLGIPDP